MKAVPNPQPQQLAKKIQSLIKLGRGKLKIGKILF